MTIDVILTGREAERVLISGASGSGKTTFAVQLVREAARAVWVDVKRDNAPGWPVVYATDFLYAGDTPEARGARLAEHLGNWPHLTVQLADLPGLSDTDQLDAVAAAVFALGNTLLVLDDAMGVVDSAPPYYLNRILTMGRSRGVGFVGITQRVHRIPLVFLTEAVHLVAFKAYGGSDVDRLARDGHAALAEVRDLAPYSYIWVDRGGGTVQLFKPLRRAA
ncbi:MAG: hypothetical protein AMXMBFR23_03450 [Chloroflexota bacterium]